MIELDHPSIHKEPYLVRAFSSDSANNIKLGSLFEIMQEAAGADADTHKAGFLDLIPQGKTWVIARMTLRVLKSPRFRDRLLIHTWPRGTAGLLALRDFMITDDTGASLVEATSTWLLLDIAKKRPLRPDFIGEKMPYYQEAVMSMDAKKVDDFPDTDLMEKIKGQVFQMYASDLDPNGHVNNTVYARVLSDCLSCRFGALSFNEIDVNFLAETFLNETLEVGLYKRQGQPLPYGAKILSTSGQEKTRFSFSLS